MIDGRENMQVTTASSDFIMNPEITKHKSNTQQILSPVEEVNSDDLEATTKNSPHQVSLCHWKTKGKKVINLFILILIK